MTIATAARAAIWLFVDMIISPLFCDVDKSPDPSFNHPILGRGLTGAHDHDTRIAVQNSFSRHHDRVIAARLGEEGQFINRLAAGFRLNGSVPSQSRDEVRRFV